MSAYFFWPIAVFVLLSAIAVVRHPNIFHAGLSLVATFGGVAALYVMLEAHFLAAVQVLVYVGAIAVILMFAVMLTQHLASREADVPLSRHATSFLICAILAAFGISVVNAQTWSVKPFTYLEVKQIGHLFLDRNGFLLPFELVAVLLLVALVGAVLVAWKESD